MKELKHKAVAFIPARSGSKRVSSKNIRVLNGHPLIAYTITAAINSGVFSDVIVSTDSKQIEEIACYYGAEVPFLRPKEYAADLSPDIEWVEYTLSQLASQGREYDCFSILRPTSPFRQPETIQRAMQQFFSRSDHDSLRAVELCGQHPGKMWVINGALMHPLLGCGPSNPPWHSTPYQALPKVYIQNASLEIAWTRVVFDKRTIAGDIVMPFITNENEGFDINNLYDWIVAEYLINSDKVSLPLINCASF